MDRYISSDKVAQLVQTLRNKGMPYVAVEDNKVVVLLCDGTYDKVGIVDCHPCEEIVAEILLKEQKALSYLTPDTL